LFFRFDEKVLLGVRVRVAMCADVEGMFRVRLGFPARGVRRMNWNCQKCTFRSWHFTKAQLELRGVGC